MADPVRVAAVQMCSGIDVQKNIDAIAEYAAEAAQAGVTYVLTPEVSIGFARDRQQMATIATPFEGNKAIAACAEIARENNIHFNLGSLAIALDDGKFANRSVLFGPDGAIIATYDKIHLFDADPPDDRPYRESDSYRAGDVAVVADAAGFRLGMSVCYDMRFPALYNMLGNAGADVFSIPAAFTVPTGRAHWLSLLRARAIETGSFVIAAAQGGTHENGRKTWGHSIIIDPWGGVLAEKGDDSPGIIIANLDISEVAVARNRLPTLANARHFSLSVNQHLS